MPADVDVLEEPQHDAVGEEERPLVVGTGERGARAEERGEAIRLGVGGALGGRTLVGAEPGAGPGVPVNHPATR